MATEATFTAAATILDERGEGLQASFATLDGSWSIDVAIGGRLTRTVDHALDATAGTVTSAAGQLFELAAECRRRATVCADYTAAMSRYRRALGAYWRDMDDDDGSGPAPIAPRRPPSPASWCDETTDSNGGW